MNTNDILPLTDVTFKWSGGDGSGTILIELQVSHQSCGSKYFELTCEVTDDGEFTIPAALMGRLPSGWSVRLSVIRSEAMLHVTDEGETIRANAEIVNLGNLVTE